MKWTTEWPTKDGTYWFYGYRYGKTPCGTPAKPKLMLMKAHEIPKGMMFVAEGHFLYKAEVEEAHFKEAILPSPPEAFTAKEDTKCED